MNEGREGETGGLVMSSNMKAGGGRRVGGMEGRREVAEER